MDMRQQVWSPLQNIAVWWGAWLFHHVPTDDFLDALWDLGGEQGVALTAEQALGVETFPDLLAAIRRATTGVDVAAGPVVRLVLAGPGDPPALPAGSHAAAAAVASGEGALIFRTNRDTHLVVVPQHELGEDPLSPNSSPSPVSDPEAQPEADGAAGVTRWDVFELDEPMPAPAWLSPGEADHLLASATEEAAQLIEQSADPARALNALKAPRLRVGMLHDFFDTPGLPAAIPDRSAKIFARADRVAAIIEVVTQQAQDHSLDPILLQLTRHIRAARIAGVDNALLEFARSRI